MTSDEIFSEVFSQPSRGGAAAAEAPAKPNGLTSVGTVVPNSTRGRKRLARMMEAAAELFLKDGYFATSIEAVLAASGGSKATLYSYFSTKEELFRAVIEEAIVSEPQPSLELLGDIKTTLIEYVVRTFEVVSSPRHRALLRLTIAERERFPELAAKYYEAGPLQSRRALLQLFTELEQQRVLPPGTAAEAADHFIASITPPWLLESLLFDENQLPSKEEVRERSVRVVERFLGSARRT